jgi:capsular polysaccharide biosynthesis protein
MRRIIPGLFAQNYTDRSSPAILPSTVEPGQTTGGTVRTTPYTESKADAMELRRYLSIVRRRLLLIIAILVAALAAGWLITPQADSYTASSTLYVGSTSIDVRPYSGEVTGDRVVGFDRIIKTFTALLPSQTVTRAGVEEAGVDRSAASVSAATTATQVENTNLVQLSVTDRDPRVARALANGVSDAFVEQINEIEPGDEPNQVISVYEPAKTPSAPDPSNLLRNLALAGLLGLVIAGSVLALLEHLDISFRSVDDVERRLELPVLGVIPALGNNMPVPPAARVQGPPIDDPTQERGVPVA